MLKFKSQETGRSIGFASHLRRHGATLANHLNYTRNEFISTLADCHQNLGIEGRASSPEKQFDEDGDEIEATATKIEWQPLKCPKCHRNSENTRKLLEHLVEDHGRPQDKAWFEQFDTIGTDLKKVFDKAIRIQAENSVVKKKFQNSNDLLVCPTDSPLAPFLLMRHLQVNFQEVSQTLTEGIVLKLQIASTSYTIIFSFHKVDKARRRIKREMARKSLERRLRVLELRCARTWVPDDDVVFKKKRTSEENKALIQALKLPATSSHDDIVLKINEMKTQHDEMVNAFCSNVYTNNVKPNGQIMSAEEKRLISSLTNDMVTPVSGKRKTTFKNPSELQQSSRKRQKTLSPASQSPPEPAATRSEL